MTIETALYPNQLNATLPPQSDIVREGAGHLRLLKTVVKTTFPNVAGAVSASQVELNYVTGVTSGIQAQIDTKGAIAGQTWTGAHVFNGTATVPTLAQGTNTTGAASTAFVQTEWATRLPNYTAPITASSTELNRLVGVTSGVQSQIDAKGAIAGQIWTGTHSFPNTTTVGPLTPTIQGHLSTVTSNVQAQINTKGAITGQNWSGTHSFPSTTTVGPLTPAIQGYLSTATSPIQAQINSKAAKAGDTYTGTHNFTSATISVPTLAPGSSGNSAASVDYANALAFASALPSQTGNSGKFITTNGATASWSDTIDGNINFTGTGRRITGDFSNAASSTRLLFQTSVGNGNTTVGAVPNGSGGASGFAAYAKSDATNSELLTAYATATSTVVAATRTGSGNFTPLLLLAGDLERLRIDQTTGNVLAVSGALGYGVGAGGTVVQATSKSNAVTLNKVCGQITMHNAALGANVAVRFAVNNTFVDPTDEVSVWIVNPVNPSAYDVAVDGLGLGVFVLRLRNNTPTSYSDSVVLGFAVRKGATS